ncbi:MAG TPA: hypothetical protein VNM90_28445 [Haliangium sp.]|nr:hypothetical protein [Haliangium sp.]
MTRDGVKQESGAARGNEVQRQATRPPGKVTLTSKLSPGRASPVQRPVATTGSETATPARSSWELTMDPWMDAAFRGATALAEHGQHAVQATPDASRPTPPATHAHVSAVSPAVGSNAAPATSAVTIDPPQPGIDKPGFIDNDDGSNIRTGPAELQGVPLTTKPLPPATRIFVSGTHLRTSEWWYVTAFLPGSIVRGYVQHFRVNTDLPEPTARLYQIQPGDTVEQLAIQEFSTAVRDGHDLRYYENVLLAVNRDKNRAGIEGTFQDPNFLGGGANNIQLEAGRRIWLVSPAYARALEGTVPDGSLTDGLYAKTQRVFAHIDDLLESVTDSPQYFGAVAGEYADAIRDHLPEIIGITAGFILAEATSAFLAATPTGVGQLAAVLIQLGLATFGASVAVEACGRALHHGQQWLTLAWTARGDAEQLAAASKEFLKMLVSVAMAALTIAGVRANVGKGLKVADAIKIQPPTLGWSPTMATPDGGLVAGGPVFTPGSIASTGPVHLGGPSLMSAIGSGSGKIEPEPRGTGKPGSNAQLGSERVHGVEAKYRWVTDQHGHRVKRYLVKNEDELLQVAENAAGGSLSNLKEIKPNWYEGEIGGQRIKIEWQPGGERVMNEGPHVKIQRWDSSKGKGGKWLAPEKFYIEGKETFHGSY